MTPLNRTVFSLFGIFLGALFFINLGSYGLLEDNEARFFEISWEMQQSGDYLVPRLNHLAHFHKPPATFWLVGAGLKLLGPSENSGRIPIAAAALVTVWLTTLFLKKPSSRLVAALVLSVNVEYWLLSRTVLTDMFLTLSVTAALLAGWRLVNRADPKAALLFWLSLSFSALVKGPVGLLIVALTLGCFRFCSGPLHLKRWLPLPGGILFLALTTPWYILVCQRFPGLFSYFLGYQTVERFTTTVHGREGPFWFFLPVILIGFLPWSVVLPHSLRQAWQKRGSVEKYLLCWLVPSLVLFSLSGSKLPTYILPLFPPMAILVARWWEEGGCDRRAGRLLATPFLVLAIGLFVLLQMGLPLELSVARPLLITTSILCALAAVVIFLQTIRNERSQPVVLTGFLFGIFLITLSFGFELVEESYSARQISRVVSNAAGPATLIAEYKDHLHALPFYLNKRVIQISYPRETQFDSPEDYESHLFSNMAEFEGTLVSDEHVLLIVRDSDYSHERFPRWSVVHKGRWYVLEQTFHEKSFI